MPVLKNTKHEAVAQAYVADREHIGWRAYKSVYPKSSQRAAETSFSDLLKKPEYKRRVDELLAAAADATVMSAREVLQGLTAIARGNVQDAAHLTLADDLVGELQDLPRDVAAAISELTVETYAEGSEESQEKQAHGGALKRRKGREVKRVKLKLHDKRGALQDMARHYKLLGGELELGGNVTVVIRKFSDGASGNKAKKRAA